MGTTRHFGLSVKLNKCENSINKHLRFDEQFFHSLSTYGGLHIWKIITQAIIVCNSDNTFNCKSEEMYVFHFSDFCLFVFYPYSVVLQFLKEIVAVAKKEHLFQCMTIFLNIIV